MVIRHLYFMNKYSPCLNKRGGGPKTVFRFSPLPPPYIFDPHFGAVKNTVGLSKLKNKRIFTF